MAKSIGPTKLYLGGVEIGDVKSLEIQMMADTDSNKFLEHMKAMEAKVIASFNIPSALFPPDSAMSYTNGATSSACTMDSIRDAMAKMLDLKARFPCEHCDDRELWRHGLHVTLVGRVCLNCLDECMNRGITIRRITVRGVSVCRKLNL